MFLNPTAKKNETNKKSSVFFLRSERSKKKNAKKASIQQELYCHSKILFLNKLWAISRAIKIVQKD